MVKKLIYFCNSVENLLNAHRSMTTSPRRWEGGCWRFSSGILWSSNQVLVPLAVWCQVLLVDSEGSVRVQDPSEHPDLEERSGR